MDNSSVGRFYDQVVSMRLVGAPVELVFAIVIGTVLRLYRLGDESLWVDEVYTVVAVSWRTWRQLLIDHSFVDPHPPFYYAIMKDWIIILGGFGSSEAVAGTSEVAIRFPSVLFGIITIPLLYRFASQLFDRWTAGLVSIFFAIAPFQIWYAQDARMYTLFVLLTIASFYLLVRLVNEHTSSRIFSYVVITTLLGYTHLYALFVILSQVLFVTCYLVIKTDLLDSLSEFKLGLQYWFAPFSAVGILLSPWIAVIVWRQIGGDPHRVAWIPPPEPALLYQAFTLFTFGYASGGGIYGAYVNLSGPPSVFLVLAIGCLLFSLMKTDLRVSRGFPVRFKSVIARDDLSMLGLLTLWLIIPATVSYFLSMFIQPVLVPHYLLASAPALLLLLARGVRAVPTVPLRYLVAVLLLSGMLIPLPGYYAEDQKEQWRDTVQLVEGSAEPGDRIILYPSYVEQPFMYYFNESDKSEVEVVTVDPGVSDSQLEDTVETEGDIYLVIRKSEESGDEFLEQVKEKTSLEPSDNQDFLGVDIYYFETGTGKPTNLDEEPDSTSNDDSDGTNETEETTDTGDANLVPDNNETGIGDDDNGNTSEIEIREPIDD